MRRYTELIGTWLTPDDFKVLEKAVKKLKTDRSKFIREAVMAKAKRVAK